MAETQNKTYEFKAEVKELLNILVHSLYTNREIFLRELISNASDALDKLRFQSTKGVELADKNLPHEIKISMDAENKILTVSDTGIGMTDEEIIKNIGTIAKSGSAEFIKQVTENQESASNIIGKFGVGFYSVFMVADKVVITSKSYKADASPVKWTSDGLGSYTLETPEGEVKRGTSIEIHLKEDAKEFTEKFRLENVIKTHSNFIQFPIYVEDEKVNNISALWREPKSKIKKEEYTEFYKFLSYDTEEPLHTIHVSVDAPIQFTSLMFIPGKNSDFFGSQREDYGLDLYVRRVLIQHKNKDLLPEYLSFVKGVVESEDLPLNISRETLQENAIFNKISNSVTSQVLNHLKKIAEDETETYKKFWIEHGKIFKIGYGDFTNREKFMELLRFNSSEMKDAEEITSLEDYTKRMKSEQKDIYYVFGSSRDAVMLDPHMEIFRKKGIEVLFFYDPADEFVISSLGTYKEFNFKSVEQADLKKLEEFENVSKDQEKKEALDEADEKTFGDLLSKIKEILGDKVTDVKVSQRLDKSPACLVNPDDSMSSSMQKIMQIMNKDASVPKKSMEINKDHKLVRNLLKVFKADNNDNYITEVVEQLYDTSLLLEGYLNDPHKLVSRINAMMEESSDWYTEVKKI
ncbi:MAG: chaperone protein HtpG [Melioribacteraceae bacterium]|nr:MAG: chaperone protein HtpG [Melioribacteraceae bacterium]